MVVRPRSRLLCRTKGPLAWGWLFIGWVMAVALGLLIICASTAVAQQPAPSPVVPPAKLSSDERAMQIVRTRELEMTRLVAMYANRLEEVLEEMQQLKNQLATCAPMPKVVLPEEPKTP